MMKMNEKIEILLSRKRMRKVDFAESVGITYRAFANYMSESRRPRREILNRIAEALGTSAEFLIDDEEELELTAEERLVRRLSNGTGDTTEAERFLSQSRGLFAGNQLSDEDKTVLMNCLIEIYEDSRKEGAK